MNPIRRWLTARAIESRVRLPGEVSCVSRISWALASSPGDAPALSSTTQASNGTIRAMVQGGGRCELYIHGLLPRAWAIVTGTGVTVTRPGSTSLASLSLRLLSSPVSSKELAAWPPWGPQVCRQQSLCQANL